jgi:hypothetical protein
MVSNEAMDALLGAGEMVLSRQHQDRETGLSSPLRVRTRQLPRTVGPVPPAGGAPTLRPADAVSGSSFGSWPSVSAGADTRGGTSPPRSRSGCVRKHASSNGRRTITPDALTPGTPCPEGRSVAPAAERPGQAGSRQRVTDRPALSPTRTASKTPRLQGGCKAALGWEARVAPRGSPDAMSGDASTS